MPVQGWVQLRSRTPQQVPGPGSQAAALQERAGARGEASSYVSITKRTQAGERPAAAKLSSLLGSTHSSSLQTPAHCWAAHTPAPCRPLLRLSFGEFRRRNATFPLGTQLTAHPLFHQSLRRDVLPPVTLQTTQFYM